MAQYIQRNDRSAHRRTTHGFLLGICCAALMTGSASAAVIGSTTAVDFTKGSTSFGYGGAGFTFTDVSGGTRFSSNPVGVSTTNGGLVTVLTFPSFAPTAYQDPKGGFNAQEFGPDAFIRFASFSAPATIPYSGSTFIIGLRADLADGMHYGYGEFAGTELLSYGFETQAGVSVLAGATISTVPLPNAAPMFGAALLALGGLGYAAKRKRVIEAA